MKKIKDFIASILYKLITFVVKLIPARQGNNHLLLIKIDEIGDYMLFRNMLQYIGQSEKYKNHKITLLGNAAWKQIFDEYDSKTVDSIIWITKKKFNRDLLYRYKLLKAIRYLKTSDVVNCIFSRSLILDDGFAWVATGSNKIGMKGNNANRGKYSINTTDSIYSEIINAGDEKIFDSMRNANYYGKILNEQLPVVTSLQITHKYKLPSLDYFMVFIGAGNKAERKWPIANFVKCAEYIAANYHLVPVICGGPPDVADADVFVNSYHGKALNYAGKTTLPEFIELSSKAKFLLSVDTGPVHMAASAGCPVIGLFSGVFYGRYGPYPKEVSPTFYSIYPDFIDELVRENNPILYGEFTLKNESIRSISVEKVIPYIDKVMNNDK